MRRLLHFLWIAGGLAIVLGFGRDTLLGLIPKPRELPRFDGATGKPWIDDGFVDPRQTGQDLDRHALPNEIKVVSSWLGTDHWQGKAETAWFKASRRTIYVAVAGYPQHRGCKLWAEFRNAAGAVTTVPCNLGNPREQWLLWEIARPAEAIAVRIRAEDAATDLTGWVGFSHPFRAWPAILTTVYQALQIFTTLALAITLLWSPGLLFGRSGTPAHVRLLRFIGGGPLVLASIGLITWLLGGWILPQVLGGALVGVAWAVIGWRLRTRDTANHLEAAERRVLALTGLVILAVVGKSFCSLGPHGELFRGTVSRNFELADRIDSRYSFYIVQAVAHHWSPISAAAENLFAPWTFFSRGPLAGLTASPIVLATGGQPPTEVPERKWVPFDTTGFAAYRITMIVLAGSVIVALFFMLLPLVGEGWATVAAGLVALSPFGVHEMMFTWPKWAATAWLLASFSFVLARRPFAGGALVGIGFLFHPLALLWSPWLGLWSLARSGRSPRKLAATASWCALGVGLIALPWMAIGTAAPHLASTPLPGQAGFLRYWQKADWQEATLQSWCRTRWMNFANTFVPLHLILSDASYQHPKLSSAYETSPPVERFSQVWWNTLPFGLGLALWAITMGALVIGLRQLPAATLTLIVGPALFITAYWGMDPLGLMRECGHPLFVAIVGVTCVIAARDRGWLQACLKHRAFCWLELPETWLMLWLTTVWNPATAPADSAQLDPLFISVNVIALAAAAWLLARIRTTENLAPALASDAVPASATPPESIMAWASRVPVWLILVAGAAILAWRRPDQVAHPQLWAEDGIFFFQAHEMGLRAWGLELAGYSQLVPRIVAAASQLVDPLWAPHVFVAAGAAAALYVMARTLSPRCPLAFKPLAALAVVLVPDAAEVLLNANNIQWILAVGAILLLISREPISTAQRIHDLAAAFLFGLTGPFSVILAPFFAIRAFRRRTTMSTMLAAIVAACGALQVVSIVLHPQPMPANLVFDLAAVAAFPGARLVATAVAGAWQPLVLNHAIGIALTVLLGAALVLLAAGDGESRRLRLTLVLLFVALLASALYRTWHSMPAVSVAGSASRYLYPLQLVFLWLLLTLAADRSGSIRTLSLCAAAWMILVNVPRLRIAPVPDRHWSEYAAKLRAGEEVTIPINPEGWSFWFPARSR